VTDLTRKQENLSPKLGVGGGVGGGGERENPQFHPPPNVKSEKPNVKRRREKTGKTPGSTKADLLDAKIMKREENNMASIFSWPSKQGKGETRGCGGGGRG